MLPLEPKRVFHYFEEISQIPRGSGNEKEISDYLVQFAKERNFEVIRDHTDSVLIRKPATAGMENAKGVILQGHMDMVCVKEAGSTHDFLKDSISLVVDGDLLKAKGTTLGADNGIAVAMALAILDSSDIPHPDLEVVITTNEEVNMNGALHFDSASLKGKYFINIDSEEEGEITIGCAGGLKAMLELSYHKEPLPEGHTVYEILVSGLKGGHSGAEIHTNRANSHKLSARLLSALRKQMEFRLVSIQGGTKDNVIPSRTEMVVAIPNEAKEVFRQICEIQIKEWKKEYSVSDANVACDWKEIAADNVQVMNIYSSNKLILLLNTLPNAVQSMSSKLPGMVESSLNLAVIQHLESSVIVSLSIRSNVRSLKKQIEAVIQDFATVFGVKFTKNSEYPEWEMNPEGVLLQTATSVYEKMTGKKPIVKAIHAGLECGVFLSGNPNLEAISIGPDMWDVHSVAERLSISSTRRVWEYVKELLIALGNSK